MMDTPPLRHERLAAAFPSSEDRSIWYCMERPRPKYRGVLHTWCALSSPVWCAYQLSLCDANNVLAAGLSLFAMAFLFSASAMYHRGRWTLAQEQRLMKLDYTGIFLLVAFSVAPCYVQLLPPVASYPVLGAPPRHPAKHASAAPPPCETRARRFQPPPAESPSLNLQ